MQKLKSADEMPNYVGVPIFKDVKFITSQGYSLVEGWHHHGTVFKTNFVMNKFAVLIGPDANHQVLHDQSAHLSSYLGRRFLVEPIFGRPMVMQDDPEHRRTRHLINPGFHHTMLTRYFNALDSTAQAWLEDRAKQDKISLNYELLRMTLSVGIRILLGVQDQYEFETIEYNYNYLIKGPAALLRLNVPFTVYGKALRARKQLKHQLSEIIMRRRQLGSLHDSQDLLGLFLHAVQEDNSPLPDGQIIDEAISLMSASHFTTASVLSWAMFELAAHANWRDRLRQELDQIIGNEPLNARHLRQLTQMTYFLKEIERLYPPIPILVRGVLKDVEYAGYRIPPGWSVIMPLFLTHRLPEIYSNPEKFDPDRFAPPREEDKQMPFSLLGFGSGAHVCIGREFALMEIRIFLAYLLRRYNWTITPNYSDLTPVLSPTQAEQTLQAQIKLKGTRLSNL